MAELEKLNANIEVMLDYEGSDEYRDKMIDVLRSSFTALLSDNSSTTTTLEQEAERVASGFRALIPNPRPDELGWFESLWFSLLLMASCAPHDDDKSQMLLVHTLKNLKESEEGSMWRDLPSFAMILRDNWASPTFEWHPEHDVLKLDQWLNLNSFIARLHGTGVLKRYNYPIWQLKEGLEEDIATEARGDCTTEEAADNRVAVACEYLIHGAPLYLRESLSETGDDLTEDWAVRSYSGGPLFKGAPGFNTERWGFWYRRLRELRSTVGKDVVPTVDRALERMKAASTALLEK